MLSDIRALGFPYVMMASSGEENQQDVNEASIARVLATYLCEQEQ